MFIMMALQNLIYTRGKKMHKFLSLFVVFAGLAMTPGFSSEDAQAEREVEREVVIDVETPDVDTDTE